MLQRVVSWLLCSRTSCIHDSDRDNSCVVLPVDSINQNGSNLNQRFTDPSLSLQFESCRTSERGSNDGTRVYYVHEGLPSNLRTHSWTLQDFDVLQTVHEGYAATVYQAYCTSTQDIVCLKVYNVKRMRSDLRHQMLRELAVHSRLRHQHIVSLLCAFEDCGKLVLVMEYADGGDLVNILQRHGGHLPESQVVTKVMQPLLQALNYCHLENVMHRDIKHKNILFTRSGVLKLADFGLAIDLSMEKAMTSVGTTGFMAPEVLKARKVSRKRSRRTCPVYNFSADTWSAGVLAYQLVTGCDLRKQSRQTELSFPGNVTESARSFITAALAENPADRPTVSKLLCHPWISSPLTRRSLQTAVATPGATSDDSVAKRSTASFTAGQPMSAALLKNLENHLSQSVIASELLSTLDTGIGLFDSYSPASASPAVTPHSQARRT